jgi:hypothetical protein
VTSSDLAQLAQPPYGDVDDRIRAIAHGLGLRLILWQYDSDDWKAGLHGVTPADVDRNYETLIESARNGTFSKVSPPPPRVVGVARDCWLMYARW